MKLLRPAAVPDSTATFSRASTATYTDKDGVLRVAAAHELRLQYANAVGAASGLLFEPAATNLLPNSAAFDNATWTKSAAAVTANTDTAPDGTLTADRIVPNGATSVSHWVRRATAIPAEGALYTVSVYVKAAELSIVRLRMAGAAYVGDAVFNAATGAWVGNAGSATRKAEALANGWWRVSVGYVMAAGDTTLTFEVWVYDAAGAASYIADGTSGVLLWGAQAEKGALTSYIPTGGAAVTRAADILSGSGLVYSSVPENDHPAWSAATNYAVGVKVIRLTTHRVYECAIAGTNSTPPEDAPSRWIDLGPTNRWAMLDKEVGTVTTTGGVPLNIVMLPGFATGVSLM
ncbi:phage head spike fiber domain-containing protein, partial [Caldimonas tepidiphila]|uniref:phage head spike fiber domain-containing protein n=1 Tax=Caldimonas tepidiphila TaxID=2315841 RepID=UPI000E5C18A5